MSSSLITAFATSRAACGHCVDLYTRLLSQDTFLQLLSFLSVGLYILLELLLTSSLNVVLACRNHADQAIPGPGLDTGMSPYVAG